MNAYQITIILTMTISGGIIGYLAARLNQEKNKVKLLEECRRVAGEMPYVTLIEQLNKDYTEGKITYAVYLDKVATVNRVYGRGEEQ
ncbi:hypothetical protein BCP78_0054 [Bacillus phage BCP78]|uniref:Uncharacterized protein n=2 Tax=Tsarbombavirus BCP78 TaxID=1985182 RepID=A0A2S0CSI6_9CAUD|nr:hypothetical protein BCP78_0054 [Bacillus phage BCP78]AEW47061.1 hypothetical protein BCP78_0054 [Bacillus phage BCP78]AQN32428.1 hypothetical protein BCP12_005 [Bacillus phage BCP12]